MLKTALQAYKNVCTCGFACAFVDSTSLVSLPDSHNAPLHLQHGRGSPFWGFPGCIRPLSPETAAHRARPSAAATSARSLSLFPALSPVRRSSGPLTWSHPPARFNKGHNEFIHRIGFLTFAISAYCNYTAKTLRILTVKGCNKKILWNLLNG